MNQVKCPECGKLLLKAEAVVGEIKCKCGKVVKLTIFSQRLQYIQSPRDQNTK